MEEQTLYGRKHTFKLPSGYEVTIREQNGEDDDVLSNATQARTLRNLSNFISSLVVDTDMTATRMLSPDDAHKLPALDRYVIMLNSRIFSLGEVMEFGYKWPSKLPDGPSTEVEYEVNLKDEFLFDYGVVPTMEEMEAKPNAVPFYPHGKRTTNIEFTTRSGKELCFDLLSAEGESYLINLPESEATKNQELVARNLRLKVDGNYEVVKNFRMFSPQDMMDIRSAVKGADPLFHGTTEIVNPETHERAFVPVIALDSFFYPRES